MDYAFLKKTLDDIQFVYDSFEEIDSILDIGPENLIFEAMFKLIEPMVNLLEQVYDCDGWISWYVLENNLGKSKLSAGYDDNLKIISNVEELIELIEISYER